MTEPMTITVRDTAANLVINNPFIPNGEAGLETDTGLIKHGNGTHAWNGLGYYTVPFVSPPATISDVVSSGTAGIEDAINNSVVNKAPTENAVYDALVAKQDANATAAAALAATRIFVDNNANTSMGATNLAIRTTGVSNTAIGDSVLSALTEGNNNVAVGDAAGFVLTTGEANTLIGHNAGPSLETGSNNTLIGTSADVANLASTGNIVIGAAAVGGADNTAQIGTAALTDITFGDGTCVLHGDGSALSSLPPTGATNLSGLSDTFVDYSTNHNLILGRAGAAALTSTASYNAFVGEGSGSTTANSTAATIGNTGIGALAARTLTIGADNTWNGFETLVALTTGVDNTAMGAGAGGIMTTGSQNTTIGSGSNVTGTGAANQTAIGYGAVASGDNTVQIGNASVTDVYFGNGSAIVHGLSTVGFRGAVLVGTTTQSIPAITSTAIIWASAATDTATLFAGGSPTKLTIPAGASKVKITGQAMYTAGTDTTIRTLEVWKNGSFMTSPFLVSAFYNMATSNNACFQVASPVLDVTPGDYFELATYQDEMGAVDIQRVYSWFQVEIVT